MATGQDLTFNTKIYRKQLPAGTTFNGNTVIQEQVFATGSLTSRDGVEAVLDRAVPAKVTFAIAPGSANITVVTMVVVDGGGQPITDGPVNFDFLISDSSLGFGETSITTSGTVVVSTGTLISTYTAKKALYVQTDATGTVVITITDTAKSTFYMVGMGAFPSAWVSRITATGDYG